MKFLSLFKRKHKQEEDIATRTIRMFATFDAVQKEGLLSFDVKTRRLFIEEPLARSMMINAEKWTAFLENAFYWLYYHQCQEAYEKYFQQEETKAVHRAQRKYAMLTHADVMRIRHARREEIKQDDVAMPKVEPFEFYVVRAQSEKPNEETKREKPAGVIVLVGTYDYDSENFQTTDWQTVKKLLDAKE